MFLFLLATTDAENHVQKLLEVSVRSCGQLDMFILIYLTILFH